MRKEISHWTPTSPLIFLMFSAAPGLTESWSAKLRSIMNTGM